MLVPPPPVPLVAKQAAMLADASRETVAERGNSSSGGACTEIFGTGIADRVIVMATGRL